MGYEWIDVRVLASEDLYDDFRDEGMCCAAVYHTEQRPRCHVCSGQIHTMVERRAKCVSPACKNAGICAVQWKVYHCTAHDKWKVMVNRAYHPRGANLCEDVIVPRLTKKVKEFLVREEACSHTPSVVRSNLMNHSGLTKPSRGWPTRKQIEAFLKRIRREQGTKNSIKAVKDFVRLKVYDCTKDSTTAFLIGPKLDSDGFPYVGSGDDDDSYIIGVTTIELIDNCVKYMASGKPVVFHADATFKLSDIGYPVITCGFTDEARSYQVAAVFVVSRRTAHEYSECFRCFARVVRELRGHTIQVQFAMGDAEDAQANALASVPGFDKVVVLMCFFHVLYNVRKRSQHFAPRDRGLIMKSITDMHFSPTEFDFYDCRDRELTLWRSLPHLKGFADYFESQWLRGRFWRWQAYHSPGGYATTNNPCEVFNAAIKTFLQRKRYHMRLLLQKLCEFLEGLTVSAPVRPTYIPTATSELKKAARAMIAAGRVQVHDVAGTTCVRVKMIDLPRRQQGPRSHDDDGLGEDEDEDGELDVAYSAGAIDAPDETDEGDDGDTEAREDGAGTSEAVLRSVHPESDQKEAARQSEKEMAAKSLALYEHVIKWSLRRSHRIGMPETGWFVNPVTRTCGCRYYFKFKICAHIEVATMKRTNCPDEVDGNPKLKNRTLGKTKRGVQPQAKTASKRRKSTHPPTQQHVTPPSTRVASATIHNPEGQECATGTFAADSPLGWPRRAPTFTLGNQGPELLNPTPSGADTDSRCDSTPLNGSTPLRAMIGRPPLSAKALDRQFEIRE